jgi:predicted metal-dependent HD superfamily phosphohydrolase
MTTQYENLDRFLESWEAIHDGKKPLKDFAKLKSDLDGHYHGADRYYHNSVHIDDGLQQFDTVRDLMETPAEIEMAWYFHDAIYDTKAPDNEEQSANLASEVLTESGVSEACVSRIHTMIMATKHDAVPDSNDAQILVDVDLSILGRPTDIFQTYEANVRKEYGWVPEETFRAVRKQILEGFLTRPHIFGTRFFRERYEANAQNNLERSIEKLS